MSEEGVLLAANTTAFDKTVDKAGEDAARATQAMVTNIRKAAQLGILIAEASGVAMNQIYTAGIEAALLTIENVAAIRVALATSTFGFTEAFQIGVNTVAIINLMRVIQQLRAGQTEQAQRSQKTANLFRYLGAMTF